MFKIEDLKEYINDDTLDNIFREREYELYTKSKMDEQYIAKITEKYPINYEELIIAIKNLPPHFNNTRENILNKLENYINRENLIMGYENEKFYKIRIL